MKKEILLKGATMEALITRLAEEFNIKPKQVEDTISLIDGGNTIPFIARYRKEVTGNLDDVLLRDLNNRLEYLRKLNKRKEEVTASIAEQEKMTPALSSAIAKAVTLQEVEDLYLPYKKKKRTRASVARERGLTPLADIILEQKHTASQIKGMAQDYVDPEKEVPDVDAALQGAMDIIAETLSDTAKYRQTIRCQIHEGGKLTSTVTKDFAKEKTEFQDYYDHSEAIKTIADHRVLAMNRGEKKKVLSVHIDDGGDGVLARFKKAVLRPSASSYLVEAVEDSYKRLIFPSVEREIRSVLKDKAEEAAIHNFGLNLKKLLLQPPFKDKVTMGYDPGYRTGCKIAVLDALGTVKATATIYPTKPHNKTIQSEKVILELIERFGVDIIAIGNGTASRESEQFIAECLKKCDRRVQYIVVNEAGASVYSASELGAEEYPDLDVSIRGAISIGGRLQDPLAELVKIDPKHIGVGQYQHDVNQKALEKVVDETIEDAVNNVGVDINRASIALLKHVSGVNKTIARNIIDYREANGRFESRKEIKKVKGLGVKAFEQCAGFLRIVDGANLLDNTGVHPESYKAAEQLLKSLSVIPKDLAPQNLPETVKVLSQVDVTAMADELKIGVPTLKDIIKELKKPGRDPRDSAPKPHLKSDVLTMDDLEEDMELVGTVRNVIDFGAFVDIGVHQDGLVHISQISDRYIKHPSEVLSIGDVVTVRVISIDKARKRIGLTMII